MNNAIYAAVLGARYELFRLDVISNNLANASTPGYRSDVPVFSSQLDYVSRPEYNASRQAMGNVNELMGASPRFSEGAIQSTGRDLDVALTGDGFFVVNTDQGEAYTRAGNFQVDTEGNLVTTKGYSVMGQGGAIVIDPSRKITISSDGTIYADDEEIDRLMVADFRDKNRLQKIGGGVFTNPGGAVVNDEPAYSISQGFLENSNVNPVREMAALVTAGRQFSALQKVVRLVNEINSRATQNLGNL